MILMQFSLNMLVQNQRFLRHLNYFDNSNFVLYFSNYVLMCWWSIHLDWSEQFELEDDDDLIEIVLEEERELAMTLAFEIHSQLAMEILSMTKNILINI